MRAGGNSSLEAHTQASSVTHFLLLSLSAAVRSFNSQIALETILLVRLLMLTKKPFLSILYVLRSSTLCLRILECNRLKYSLYLRLLLAK
jgi:hypothetical protein